MTKYLILITILIILYLYWKTQQNQSSSPPLDEIIERKGKQKEIFWDAEDYDLNSDDSDEENQTTIHQPQSVELPSAKFIPINDKDSDEEKPILSHKQKRKLKKK